MTPSRHDQRWYRGDCHVHTIHSDGELTPEQVLTEARAAGLDFIATTEHNTTAAHDQWGLPGNRMLVLLGVEVSTPDGHWLALGLDSGQSVEWRYDAVDASLAESVRRVHANDGLCVAAHPYAPYPTGTFGFPLTGFDAIEVWNGLWESDRPWNADNEAALADWVRALVADVGIRRWRPAVGNSDAHLAGQVGTPQTVVMCESLSAPAVLAGLRAGRSWIAESAGIDVSISATAGEETAGIGQELDSRNNPVTVRAVVDGVAAGTATLFTDHGVLSSAATSGDRSTEITAVVAEGAFVRLEVRYADGRMAALTNPIILRSPWR